MYSSSPQLNRRNIGFLLAKASQRWNNLLYARFSALGFSEVRPSFGSVLIPLYEEDGLRLGEIAQRARLSKQAMTTLIQTVEHAGLVKKRVDPEDSRAIRVYLTAAGRRFEATAEKVLRELDRHSRELRGDHRLDAVCDWLSAFTDVETINDRNILFK